VVKIQLRRRFSPQRPVAHPRGSPLLLGTPAKDVPPERGKARLHCDTPAWTPKLALHGRLSLKNIILPHFASWKDKIWCVRMQSLREEPFALSSRLTPWPPEHPYSFMLQKQRSSFNSRHHGSEAGGHQDMSHCRICLHAAAQMCFCNQSQLCRL